MIFEDQKIFQISLKQETTTYEIIDKLKKELKNKKFIPGTSIKVTVNIDYFYPDILS